VKRNRRRPGLKVTTGGKGVVGHAGARLLSDLADTLGLGEALSAAVGSTRVRRGGHDRGEVLVDLAVMLADGGETLSDLAVLRDQPELFGEVASTPTAWRTLAAIDEEVLAQIAEARAEARAAAWAAGVDPAGAQNAGSAGCSGDVGGHDVGGVTVERDPRSVVAHGGARVGVGRSFLQVAQRHAGIETGSERCSKYVECLAVLSWGGEHSA
jgi:hypothetical protein